MDEPNPVAAIDPAGRLSVQLLGGFSVSIDGVALAPGCWPSLRSAQLVQLLCLAPQRRLTRDRRLHAIGLIPQHDFECGEAGVARGLDRANDERRTENGLEELRLAREIPDSIVVTSREHERLPDNPPDLFVSKIMYITAAEASPGVAVETELAFARGVSSPSTGTGAPGRRQRNMWPQLFS